MKQLCVCFKRFTETKLFATLYTIKGFTVCLNNKHVFRKNTHSHISTTINRSHSIVRIERIDCLCKLCLEKISHQRLRTV